jgi:DNA-directed RNA polymerase subunit RPC12/RpoP
MAKTIECPQCGGVMKRKTISEGNFKGLLLALVLLGAGIALSLTGIGALVGIPLILFALFTGGKRKKGWKCKNCGYFFEAK